MRGPALALAVWVTACPAEDAAASAKAQKCERLARLALKMSDQSTCRSDSECSYEVLGGPLACEVFVNRVHLRDVGPVVSDWLRECGGGRHCSAPKVVRCVADHCRSTSL